MLEIWGKDSVPNEHIFMGLRADIEERVYIEN